MPILCSVCNVRPARQLTHAHCPYDSQRPLKDRRSVLAVPSHNFQKVLDVLTTKTTRKGDERPTSGSGRGKDDAKAAPPNAHPPAAGRSSARPSSSSKPSKSAASAAPNTPAHGAAHKGAAPIILVPSGCVVPPPLRLCARNPVACD